MQYQLYADNPLEDRVGHEAHLLILQEPEVCVLDLLAHQRAYVELFFQLY